ncbi:hypothetical protein ABA45_17455 [Marinobacter psychrophilus]|uniref:DUF3581 domain-containing protein n=1 Tax=Marinobacter psychrophilus TaxID=330734 RepID=A0A0H4I8D8_9GAMM|nr:DUF3581 domain-containing protein [Marinobacter psychrophilus]AKO54003.1 hypothetical protein ABA45_17455 [Marinobacter psychrophilus]
MFLERFHCEKDGRVYISAAQASLFAKEVAGDFNPIHDPDARRFCVPGDLLFAVVLWRFGLSTNMTFHFRALLGKDVPLEFCEGADGTIQVCDQAGKVYLEVARSGDITTNKVFIEEFTLGYVAASGKNFPHTMKPLMESNGVMFNPDRPMVMYDSMTVTLDSLHAASPELELHNATLEANGKRGQVTLEYRLMSGDQALGTVSKRLVLGGLRPYCADAMADVVEQFYRLKARGVSYGTDIAST